MIIKFDDIEAEYARLKSHQLGYIPSTGSQPSSMLILLTPDVDSICSARILVDSLKSDLIQFILRPVNTQKELIDITNQYLQDENVSNTKTEMAARNIQRWKFNLI